MKLIEDDADMEVHHTFIPNCYSRFNKLDGPFFLPL